MRKTILLLMFAGLFACNRTLKPEEVETRLKESMSDFLNKSPENQANPATFTVKDVTYFPAKEFYECEFVVGMKKGAVDTTGVMKAKVSYDFTKVIRRL